MSTPPPDDTPTPESDVAVAPTERKFEKLERYEKLWLRIGIGMLVLFGILTGYQAFTYASMGTHGSKAIAPDKVSTTPPFDKPGTFENEDGSWTAVGVAYAFGFLPKGDLVVPEDVDVHFMVSSIDVVHGFQIPGVSNVNMMVLPGHVSEVTQRFSTPGRYIILCNEYCGSAHHFMVSHIRVLKKGEDPANPPPLKNGVESTTSVREARADDTTEGTTGMDHGDDA